MRDIKMSEMFPEAFQVEHNKSFEVQDAAWYSYGEKYESDGDQDSAIEHAVLNHDRLVEENAQQRESLDAFRELVKAQTKTMNELNERCKELAEENAELREALEGAIRIKDLWLPMRIVCNEHEGEVIALHRMYNSFEKLLNK